MMRRNSTLTLCLGIAAVLVCSGCTSLSQPRLAIIEGDSCVLVGSEPAGLAFAPARGHAVRVRSAYSPGQDAITYVEGRDYLFDAGTASIVRTPDSRIPDFATNILYGQSNFDHSKFPGYGNLPFFVYVDYAYPARRRWPIQPLQAGRLKKTRAALRRGEPVRIVAFGDSITAGGETSRPEWIYWQRWADSLAEKYPAATITAINGATGGDSTVQGLARLEEKVLNAQPTLVIVAFGMNDHNRGGVDIPEFERNLNEMIARIRETTNADVVLVSTFPPNPEWMHSSNRMSAYAAATFRVAEETKCAYADVYTNWMAITANKKPEDLLANNINHPNDYGHWVYFRVLEAMGL